MLSLKSTTKTLSTKPDMLPYVPGASEFEYYFTQACRKLGKPVAFSWKSGVPSEVYIVKIVSKMNAMTQWQLIKETSAKRELMWERFNNDYLIILNLIESTCMSKQPVSSNVQLTENNDQSMALPMSAVEKSPVSNGARSALNEEVSIMPSLEVHVPSFTTNISESAQAAAIASSKLRTLLEVVENSPKRPQDQATNCREFDLPVDQKYANAVLFLERTENAITGIKRSLTDETSGLFTHAAFLFILEQEYFRAFRAKSSLSIVILKISVLNKCENGKDLPLPLDAKLEAIARIDEVKRQVDTFAHLDDERLVLILPCTSKQGAKRFVNRCAQSLTSRGLCFGIDSSNLHISTGIASVPADVDNLTELLTKAHIAQVDAEESSTGAGSFLRIA